MSILKKIKSLFRSEPRERTETEKTLDRIKKLASKEYLATSKNF